MVKDIVFVRSAAGHCTDAAFRARCGGNFKGGPTTHRVTLNAEWQLVLKPDNQPAYRLAPHHGRRFPIIELEGFGVEFVGEATIVDEVIFHQPNGTFVARRVEGWRLEAELPGRGRSVTHVSGLDMQVVVGGEGIEPPTSSV